MTPPPRPDRELALTRNHLYALGTLALALAVLSFFVGVQVGRGEAVPAPAPPVPALVAREVREGDLQVLLANVEAANAASSLTFPEELPKTEPPPASPDPNAPPPDPNAPATQVAAAAPAVAFPAPERPGSAAVAPAPVAAPVPPQEIPAGAFAVQVATRADERDAAALVETLRAAGLSAYRVPSLVDGQSVWRVRVGGYASRDAATAALPEVGARSGSADAVVTAAP